MRKTVKELKEAIMGVPYYKGLIGWCVVVWFIYLLYFELIALQEHKHIEPTPACKAMTVQAETIEELMKVFTARNELTIMKEGRLDR